MSKRPQHDPTSSISSISELHKRLVVRRYKDDNNNSTEFDAPTAFSDPLIPQVFANAKRDRNESTLIRQSYILHRGNILTPPRNPGVQIELLINNSGNRILGMQIPPQVFATVFYAFFTEENKNSKDETIKYLAQMSTIQKLQMIFDIFYSSREYILTRAAKESAQTLIDPGEPDREKALTGLKNVINQLVYDATQFTEQSITDTDQEQLAQLLTIPPDDDKLETCSNSGSDYSDSELGSMILEQTDTESLTQYLERESDSEEEDNLNIDSSVTHITSIGNNDDDEKCIPRTTRSNHFKIANQPQNTPTVRPYSNEEPTVLQAQRWLLAHAFSTLLHMNSKDVFILFQQLELIPKHLAFDLSAILSFMTEEINKYNFGHEHNKFDDIKEAIMTHLTHFISTEESGIRDIRIKINSDNINFIKQLIEFIFNQNESNQSIMQFTWQLLHKAAMQPRFWDAKSISQADKLKFMVFLLETIEANSDYFIQLCTSDNTRKPLDFLEGIYFLSQMHVKEQQNLVEKWQNLAEGQQNLAKEWQNLIEAQQKHLGKQPQIAEEQQRLAEEQQRLTEEQQRLIEEQQRLAEEQHNTVIKHLISICRALYGKTGNEEAREKINRFVIKITNLTPQELRCTEVASASSRNPSIFSRRKRDTLPEETHPALMPNQKR